jgi:pimeloyl-ACP methyl ester carboxylesterase
MDNRTYTDEVYWRSYLPYFPESLQISDSLVSQVQEERWNWKCYSIHLDRIDVSQAQGKIILLHGIGGYGRFLLPIGLRTAQLGYSVVAPDLPGYGLTKRSLSELQYSDWIHCVSDLIDHEHRRDGLPIFLFGLSAGGMLAYQSACKQPHLVQGVAATCLLDFRDEQVRKTVSRYPWMGNLGYDALHRFSWLLDPILFPMKYVTKTQFMSNQEAFNSLVLSDRLGGANRVPARFLRTLLSQTPEIEPENFNIPLLLVHPEKDRWTPLALSEVFFNRLAGSKKLQILENCGHAPLEEPGILQLEQALVSFFR